MANFIDFQRDKEMLLDLKNSLKNNKWFTGLGVTDTQIYVFSEDVKEAKMVVPLIYKGFDVTLRSTSFKQSFIGKLL